jgi:hypothetical protein
VKNLSSLSKNILIMSKEFNYRFYELVIDQELIKELLGYKDVVLPPPFDAYLEEALKEAVTLPDIFAKFIINDKVIFDENLKNIRVGGQEFNPGKTLLKELKGSEQLAFFITTAGKTICEMSAKLMNGEDPVLGYVYDILGSVIADAAADRMQSFLKLEVEKEGLKITNRYSPGYCNWSVADQHKLFSLFGGSTCGVSLTDSSLMYPVKSISGVIGIGQNVKYREYQCALCEMVNCSFRRLT